MARLRKRSRKFQGTRNHGKGNTKNRRGKGGKGGWGRAGMHKHRFTYMTVYERGMMAHGGRFGFAPQRLSKLKTLNLYEIEQRAVTGKLQKKDGKDYLEFEGKVLGTGSITKIVAVKAIAFSAGAIKKIKAAGGSAETFPQKAGEAKKEEKKQ